MKQGSYLRVARWDEFQHYKKRNPPWIKLYTYLLDDFEFCELPEPTRLHLLMIWLLASKNGGLIPENPAWIQSRINSKDKPNLELLVRKGFLECYQDASNMLAGCVQDASVSRDRAETEQSRAETDIRPGSDDDKPKPAEIRQVFDHYCKVMNRNPNQYTLTEARRKKIYSRLRESTPERLMSAINACRASPFHMGDNDRGTLYNDLIDNILKSEEQVDKWINQPKRGSFNGPQAR